MEENKTINRFFELVNQIDLLKEQLKPLQKELDEYLETAALNRLFQDEKTKIVYRVVEQNGTWVEFKRRTYQRTRKVGEAKGSISIKEAKDAGFTLSEEI